MDIEKMNNNKLVTEGSSSVSDINYNEPSANDQIAFYNALEKSKNANRSFKDISELFDNGKLNKELFAGLMLFRAPRKILISSPEGANEVISFLKALNIQLSDDTLKETIAYLESLVPYLDTAHSLKDEMLAKSTELFEEEKGTETMADLEEKADAMNKTSQTMLLSTQAGTLFTTSRNKTYQALWNKYLIEDGK